jgi:transcriptional regulator with XRE-family HTH domain
MSLNYQNDESNYINNDIHAFLQMKSNNVKSEPAEKEFMIGERVRVLRKQKGLSIRSLAESCGISVNTLSLIENDRTSPNINTLKLLANGLDVAMPAFFEDEKPEHGPVYQQNGKRAQLQFANGTLEKLGEGLPPLGAEPIIVTLENSTKTIEDISHTGREFIYCLEGKITCYISEQPYHLQTGDSILFNARSPHRWINAQQASSQLLVLFCPMDPQDQPAERHLEP